MDDRVRSWLWVLDVFRACFCCLAPWWFHHSLDDAALCVRAGHTSTTTAVSHLLYCCMTHGGWVDRFAGVTAVIRTAVLLQHRVVGG